MKFSFAYVLLFLLSACGDNPLPKPKLLQYPESEWPVRAEKLKTREIFEVYRYYRSLKPPNASVGAELLGARGKEAFTVWAESVEREEQPLMTETLYFDALVINTRRYGGYDLCADAQMLDRAATLMRKEIMAQSVDETKRYIQRQCDIAK